MFCHQGLQDPTALLLIDFVPKVITYITRKQIIPKHLDYIAAYITFHFVLKILSVICVCQYCPINKHFSQFDIIPLKCQI